MENYIGLGLLTLFVFGFFAVGVSLGKKRKKEMRQLAEEMNFSFDGEFTNDDDPLIRSLSHLALFREGSTQGAWNVMRAQADDVAITILDHRFGSGTGKSRKVSEQTVIVFQSDLLRLPAFTLRRQDLGHTLSTALLGYEDVDFADHPVFSKRYHLHGSDEESIRERFSDNVLTYFEQHENLVADGSGDSLLVCKLRKTVAVKDMKAFLEDGYEVFNLFKGAPEGVS